ncbi:CAP domain-containing protein [Scopulibacillus cellulosilyticus]|uniref:CAP domain-containing protein n=1 Tax=Scopulibacillus cellulosilyticus TaxID=2665665 RepID=A0ABW2PTH9_9BACL
MRKINIFIFAVAVIVFCFTFLFNISGKPNDKQHQMKSESIGDAPTQSKFKVPSIGLYTYMGDSKKDIEKKFGKPERIDPTQYGYDWWIYGRGTENYVQIGIDHNKVVTIYALGKKLDTKPFGIGKSSHDIYKKVPMSDTASLNINHTHVEFEFNEEDLMIRPLMKFGNVWVQLYFDHFTDRLVSVRYLTPEVLMEQKPYTLTYQGHLEKSPEPSESEWQAINNGESKEIFDITNVLRKRYHVNGLDWNNQAQTAAYLHSKDMKENNYFSHDSKTQGDLSQRLKKQGINFQAAGENIAAQYTDGIAAEIGWLNSEDHRKNLLSNMFTGLGVGVYQDDYTQDFVNPF